MNKDLINILVHSNKEIDNQLLMDYISGHLSDADQHSVEEWLDENQFAADALEGLQEFGNKEQLNEYVNQLNRELKSYLQQKKQKREKRRWKDNPWTAVALVLILGLIFLAYVVLRLLGNVH
jgi:ferric-dicitrate binding protein FerR (iron transport regulator)